MTANVFEIHYVSQEHGTIFLFWKHGLYSFGVTLGRKKNLYQNFKIYNVKGSSLSSLSLPPTKLAFRLVIEHGPLLMVALGVVLGPLSSSSLLPWELSLSPSDACISTCKA
jgi:hypothetical protein